MNRINWINRMYRCIRFYLEWLTQSIWCSCKDLFIWLISRLAWSNEWSLERTGFEVVKRSRIFTFCGVISLIEINGLNKRSYLCISGGAISLNFWVNSAIPISLTLRWKFPRDIWIPNPAMILWQIPHPADIWIPNPATILEPIPYPATKKGLIPHPAKPHRGPLYSYLLHKRRIS